MAIKNWDYQTLHMDYSSMYKGNKHPSDIDMLYIGKDKVLILGEKKKTREAHSNGDRGDCLRLSSTDGKVMD